MFVQTENTPNPNSLKFLPGIISSFINDFKSYIDSSFNNVYTKNFCKRLLVNLPSLQLLNTEGAF